jgi:hypothetical protein
MYKFKSKKMRTVLCVAVGLIMLGAGVFVALWRDGQAILYNQGLQSYVFAQTAGMNNPDNPVHSGQDRMKMLIQAAKMFDLSVRVYKIESKANWITRFVFPSPDRNLAAKASFRKGNCLEWLGDEKDAVEAYKVYLQLNPGGDNDKDAADTIVDQHNLELVYNHNPDLQKQEGKGKGNGNSNGDPDKQQDPGDKAGHQPHTKM